jgi:hypothetical protein
MAGTAYHRVEANAVSGRCTNRHARQLGFVVVYERNGGGSAARLKTGRSTLRLHGGHGLRGCRASSRCLKASYDHDQNHKSKHCGVHENLQTTGPPDHENGCLNWAQLSVSVEVPRASARPRHAKIGVMAVRALADPETHRATSAVV